MQRLPLATLLARHMLLEVAAKARQVVRIVFGSGSCQTLDDVCGRAGFAS
jgi:hypothetical protein